MSDTPVTAPVAAPAAESTPAAPQAEAPKGIFTQFAETFAKLGQETPDADAEIPDEAPAELPPQAKKAAATPVAKKSDREVRDAKIKESQARRAYAAEKAALEAKVAESEKFAKLVENAKDDPWALLRAAGFEKPEDLIAKAAEKGAQTQTDKEVAAIKKQLEDERNSRKAEQDRQFLDNVYKTVVKEVTDAGEKYDLTKAEAQFGTVMDVINQHWNNTFDPETGRGEALTITEAADMVESFLEEKANQRIAKSKKLQAKLGQQAKPSTPTNSAPRTPRTLGPQHTARTGTAPKAPEKEEDRTEWLGKQLQGMFKHF